MKIRSMLLCAGMATIFATAPAQAQSEDAYTGSVFATAGTYCPDGSVETAGQLLQINEYTALYSLLGVQFGGDGRSTFGIPDLRGRSPLGYGQGPGFLVNFPVGYKGGAEQVALGITQLPAHTHGATTNIGGSASVRTSTNGPSTGNPLGNAFATFPAATSIYATPSATTVAMAAQTVQLTLDASVVVQSTGFGQAFSIRSPFQALRFCIVTNGLYPPRP